MSKESVCLYVDIFIRDVAVRSEKVQKNGSLKRAR